MLIKRKLLKNVNNNFSILLFHGIIKDKKYRIRNYNNKHILDIKFYLLDEDGNEIENKDGTTKEFRLKNNIRYKPLEYVCEDLSPNMLEEVK